MVATTLSTITLVVLASPSLNTTLPTSTRSATPISGLDSHSIKPEWFWGVVGAVIGLVLLGLMVMS
jgi:bacteriorhodopsin